MPGCLGYKSGSDDRFYGRPYQHSDCNGGIEPLAQSGPYFKIIPSATASLITAMEAVANRAVGPLTVEVTPSAVTKLLKAPRPRQQTPRPREYRTASKTAEIVNFFRPACRCILNNIADCTSSLFLTDAQQRNPNRSVRRRRSESIGRRTGSQPNMSRPESDRWSDLLPAMEANRWPRWTSVSAGT